jgi:N,N'-diacetyllegionaminate synthase
LAARFISGAWRSVLLTWSDKAGDSGPVPSRCVIIGEVAQAHDGSLGTAHAFIDAIAAAGADGVKFQTHIAAAESTVAEPWRVPFSPQDATRYDYWQRMQFTEDQWHALKRHAEKQNLLFLSSPFSMEAVELLERVGVSAWKVASGELANAPMLQRMAKSGLPVILSSGLSHVAELDAAVALVKANGSTPIVLQCTSAYPCPPEKIGLNMIPAFRGRYGCPVGLSDHSGTMFPGLAAATLGIAVLEVHVTLSRQAFGPDVVASVTMTELRELVNGVRFIETMMRQPVDKDLLAEELAPLRALFTKSVACRVPLPSGTILKTEHLTVKKPGTGIPASQLTELLGLRLRRAVSAEQLLCESDLEPA